MASRVLILAAALLAAGAVALTCKGRRVVAPNLPDLVLSTNTLLFTGVAGQSAPRQQYITTSVVDSDTLGYDLHETALWLEAFSRGVAPDTVFVNAFQSGLPTGTHKDTIRIIPRRRVDTPVRLLEVTMVVTEGIVVQPRVVRFSWVTGNPLPEPETLTVQNPGGGVVTFTASEAAPWLLLSGAAGTAPAPIEVSIDTAGLAAGKYGAPVTISSPQAVNSPITATCSLSVVAFDPGGGGKAYDLRAVHFIDPLRGWAVGQLGGQEFAGVALSTTDGGINWVQNPEIFFNTALGGVHFVDASHGWAVGDLGTILSTTDGGANWERRTLDNTKDYWEIDMTNADTGYIVGTFGTILRTIDGGENWQEQTSGTQLDLSAVDFVTSREGWAVGNAGAVLHTSNAGQTWSVQESGFSGSLLGVDFVNADTGWVVGTTGGLLRSIDGGASWQPQTSTTSENLDAVSFFSSLGGWACGTNGAVVRTLDAGAHWEPVNVGTTKWLFDVFFLNSSTGWLVGQEGVTVRTQGGN